MSGHDGETVVDEQSLNYKVVVDSILINALSANVKHDLVIGSQQQNLVNLSARNQTTSGYNYELLCNQGTGYVNCPIETGTITVTITGKTYAPPPVNGEPWAVAGTASANLIQTFGVLGSPARFWLPGCAGFCPLPLQSCKDSTSFLVQNAKVDTIINPVIIDSFVRGIRKHRLDVFNTMSPIVPDYCDYYANFSAEFPYIADTYPTTAGQPMIRNQINKSQKVSSLANKHDNPLGFKGRYMTPASTVFTRVSTGAVLQQVVQNGIVLPSADGTTVWYSTGGDSLMETLTFNVSEFLFHSLLGGYEEHKIPTMITKLDKFTIQNKLTMDPTRILCFSYPSTSLNFAYATAVNTSTVVPSVSIANITNCTVSLSNLQLNMMSVDIPPELTLAPVCRIPYSKYDDTQQDFPVNWTTGIQQKLQINPINLNKVPSAIAICVETFDRTLPTNKWSRGLSTARIQQVSFKIGSGPDSICANLTEQNLYELSRENGVENYDWADIVGRNITRPYRSYEITAGTGLISTLAVAGNPAINQVTGASQMLLSDTIATTRGCGTRIYLKFGKDIPLQDSMLCSGVGDLVLNFSFYVNAVCNTSETSGFARLHYQLFYDAEVDLVNNTGVEKEAMFGKSDVLKAYSVIRGRGQFERRAQMFQGGSLYSNLQGKLKAFLPKIPHYINTLNSYREKALKAHDTAMEIHKKVKPYGTTAKNLATMTGHNNIANTLSALGFGENVMA